MSDYLNKSMLKERGWTEGLIKKKLPEPKIGRNPLYRSQPVYLYRLDDVLVGEESEEFKKMQETRAKRCESAEKAVLTRYKRTSNWLERNIEALEIEVLSDDELTSYVFARQVAVYEYKLDEKWDWDFEAEMMSVFIINVEEYEENPTTPTFVDEETLQRWKVNFIRHELTNYDYLIRNLKGKPDKYNLVLKLKEALFKKIAEAYPALSDECERQLRRFTDGGNQYGF